jgi:hypothetical protein
MLVKLFFLFQKLPAFLFKHRNFKSESQRATDHGKITKMPISVTFLALPVQHKQLLKYI